MCCSRDLIWHLLREVAMFTGIGRNIEETRRFLAIPVQIRLPVGAHGIGSSMPPRTQAQ